MSDSAYTLDVKGLDQMLKAIKAKTPVARIGILHDSKRTGGNSTNAQVGAAHEFGTSKMPKRSFLREPLNDHLSSKIEESNLINKEVMAQVIKQGSVIPWLKQIATLAEGIVLEAFSSNGFGKWAPWKGIYTSRTGQILVDSNQLRDSISTEVKA